MDVSDRRMQVQLTQEAKIASDFHFIRAIFAVVGFVSALGARRYGAPLRMLTKSTDWQSVEKARKQGNFASGKICRRRRLDLTIPKGSANPPKEANLHPRELT